MGEGPTVLGSPPRVVDVARAAGVSPATVSNVYNRPEVVREELRLRVLEAAARLGFAGANPTARNLRRGRAQAVGVIFRERLAYAFADLAAVGVLQGIAEGLDPHQLALVILPAAPENGTAEAPGIRDAAVDGLILYSLTDDDPLVRAAVRRRLPLVVVDAPDPEPYGLPFVGIDDVGVGRTAMQHLLDLGHRRVGVVSLRLSARDRPGAVDVSRQQSATSYVARRRLEGAAAAAGEAGLDWAAVPVVQSQLSTIAEGRAAARVLLDQTPDLTAVLALSDPLALGVIEEAQARGHDVPGGLSVIGVDNTAPEHRGLTTVDQPHRAKGRRAADLLITTLEHRGPAGPPERLPATLLVGTTTGPPRR